MRDKDKDIFNNWRPADLTPGHAINYCLARLFCDQEHETGDPICDRLTFEAVIGALLMCRDMLEELHEHRQFMEGYCGSVTPTNPE